MSKMESPEFVLSTLAKAPENSPTPYIPRARFCIFRGFWAELPENEHNNAPKNERVFESEVFTFTTDVRMQKVGELFHTSSGKADSEELVQGSGGGGSVEAVWWVKGEGMQWRVRGKAFVVANDIEENDVSSGVRTVKSEVGSRMRLMREGKGSEWSWKKEVDSQFGNLSPAMRGSFKAPPPGQPCSKPFDGQKYRLGAKVDTLVDTVARENFRVVLIVPDWVEKTDIGGTEDARRYQYDYKPESGEWAMTETWP
jgi:pyridoxamine 5'-phosphate oxidase